MVRHPAVAGKFYTDDPERLRRELQSMVPAGERDDVLGIVAPHAGYIYSGGAAGAVYGAIRVPDTVLLLGPNHTGMGAAAALSPAGGWLTPLGTVPVDERLSQLILAHAPLVREDALAHRYEHSLEVQLPFLQYVNPNVRIAALCLALPDFASIAALGAAVAAAIREYGEEVLIVASSDMTHYESAQAAREKDEYALARLAALDAEGLYRVCRDKGITMCGVIPASAMLVAVKALGATSSRLVTYTNSGEVNGDTRRVVAYAALTVS